MLRIPALLVCALIALAHPLVAATWTATGPTASGGGGDRSVRLSDGRVLVVHPGGAAERYAPASGTWSPAGHTVVPRTGFSLTALPLGYALAAGGTDADGGFVGSYELYSSATNSWSVRGPLLTARSGHIAEPLGGGRVLIAGGWRAIGPEEEYFQSFLDSAEILDPLTGTATATGSLSTLRAPAVSARLRDGRILVVGGYAGSSGSLQPNADLYDPMTGTWTPSANEMPDPIDGFTVTALPDGRALIAGGRIPYAPFVAPDTTIFDPATRTFATTAALRVPRADHTATLLADGRVLIAGGTPIDDTSIVLAEAEVWHPWFGAFLPTVPMHDARADHPAVRLRDGRVLVIGGRGAGTACELYRPRWWLIDLIQSLRLPPPPAPPGLIAAG